MLRFQFEPEPDEEFEFRHFSLEGNNARRYALLGWNDLPEGGDPEQQPMFQMWFDTVGDAMRFAQDKLGIPKDRWIAPLPRSGSGRVAPPIPPPLKDNRDEDE